MPTRAKGGLQLEHVCGVCNTAHLSHFRDFFIYPPLYSTFFIRYSIFKVLHLRIKMPAKNPRTNLTLPADLDAVISDLAHLRGTAKAKIITELLLEVQPVLEQIRDALKVAQENEGDAVNTIKDFANSMLIQGNEKLGNIASEVKKL